MYRSLFIIINENGLVAGWQLCRSSAFEDVKKLLKRIVLRLSTIDSHLQIIAVDNCCQWRSLLHAVFGTEVKVKLDWFHGIKPVLSEISHKKGTTVELRAESNSV